MKKSHYRSIVWAFLIVASFASYVYLKNVPIEEYQEFTIEETHSIDENDIDEGKIILADIALAKKIIDLTKLLLSKD